MKNSPPCRLIIIVILCLFVDYAYKNGASRASIDLARVSCDSILSITTDCVLKQRRRILIYLERLTPEWPVFAAFIVYCATCSFKCIKNIVCNQTIRGLLRQSCPSLLAPVWVSPDEAWHQCVSCRQWRQWHNSCVGVSADTIYVPT